MMGRRAFIYLLIVQTDKTRVHKKIRVCPGPVIYKNLLSLLEIPQGKALATIALPVELGCYLCATNIFISNNFHLCDDEHYWDVRQQSYIPIYSKQFLQLT